MSPYWHNFGDWALVISIASFLLGIAQLVFLYNMIVSWKWGPRATNRGARRRSSGRFPPAADLQLRRIPRVVGGPYEFGVPEPGTRSWPAVRRRSRRLSPRWSAPPVAGARYGGGRARDRRRVQPTISRRHLVARGLGRRWDRAGVTRRGLQAADGCSSRCASEWTRSRLGRLGGAAGQPVVAGRSSTATSSAKYGPGLDVTQEVLAEFGIEALGAVFDPDPLLALDDAIRGFAPREVLLSSLYETRYGVLRRDFVEWAKEAFDVPVTHSGPGGRRRGSVGRHAHARRRHQDREQRELWSAS